MKLYDAAAPDDLVAAYHGGVQQRKFWLKLSSDNALLQASGAAGPSMSTEMAGAAQGLEDGVPGGGGARTQRRVR